VEVESNKGILLSRALWDAGQQQYFADISSVIFTSDTSRGESLVSLARSTDLPFVNKWTITDHSYATWTHLTVTVETSEIDVIVDDRLALSFPYPGVSNISRGTIAIVAGNSGSGGIASCIFDQEEVGVFPRDGGPD
jgi:hypothetical protein